MTINLVFLDHLAENFSTSGMQIAASVLIVGAAIVLLYLLKRLRTHLAATDRHNPSVDMGISTIVASIFIAGGFLILGVWGVAGSAVQAILRSGLGVDTVSRILVTLLLIVGTFLVANFIKRFIDELIASHEAVSDHQREVTYRVTQITLYIVAGLIVLGIWQVDLSGLLIGAGFLGIIIGMAARQTIAAILSGFVLMFSRPFEIGDWIAVEENEGIVTDITAFNTRIQTFDGEYVIVPNNEISAKTVTNRSRKGRLRLRVQVGVDYDSDLDHVIEVIKEAINDLDEILTVPTPQVVLTGFGDSAIIFEIKFWIDKPSTRRRWRAIQAVVRSVNNAFRREGIKIPFPQRELSGRQESGGFQIIGARDETIVSEPEFTPQSDGGDS